MMSYGMMLKNKADYNNYVIMDARKQRL